MNQSWEPFAGPKRTEISCRKNGVMLSVRVNNTYGLKFSMQGLGVVPRKKEFSNRKEENVVMDHRMWATALWQWKKKLWSSVCSRRDHLKRDTKVWTFLYKAVRTEPGIVYISSGHALKEKKGCADFRKCQELLGWWSEWRVKSLACFPRQAKAKKGRNSLKAPIRYGIPAEFVIGTYSHVLKRLL